MGEELPLTLGVERAARLIGVGRSTMYTAVKRGDCETIRLNGRTVLLTLPVLERIGVAVDATATWHRPNNVENFVEAGRTGRRAQRAVSVP